MIEFALFLFGTVGFVITFMLGSIFRNIRDFIEKKSEFLGEMIYCPLCFGFWSGIVSGLIFGYNPILSGFTVGMLSWVAINNVRIDE